MADAEKASPIVDDDAEAWLFDYKQGWVRIADPLESESQDFQEALKENGYSPYRAWGVGDIDAFSFDVHKAEEGAEREAPYPFIVTFSDAENFYNVYVGNLPSLIELAHKLAAIAQASVVTSAFESLEATLGDESEKTDRRSAARQRERMGRK